jgi:glyoxylase-like metal-dependent hydrolase (beta-lactamase superfamily II)
MPPLLIPARNASEWTGPTGNNTWLLMGREPALVDAGVGNPEHLAELERALDGATLARVFITHGHSDHVGGLPELRARWPKLEVIEVLPPKGGSHESGSHESGSHESGSHESGSHESGGHENGSHESRREFPAGDTILRVIPTPGHAPDHLCFFDEASRDLYCGDLARLGGTVVIPASKGGNLGEYLASLERIRALQPRRLLPGHGPIVDDPIALIDHYVVHRAMRDRKILDAIAAGARTPEEIVERVYFGLSASLKRAAADTVEAHLHKLKEEGRVR